MDEDGAAPLVVVAEDDHELRFALTELLVGDGYEVVSVPDGEHLIDCLARYDAQGRRPAVIITDHRMPRYTALDVLEILDREGWEVPVIVMTAFGAEIAGRVREAGARAVFDKPFDPDDMRTAVLFWAGTRARAREHESSPDESSPDAS
jgi:CheY-like chemotaxis protein